MPPKTELPHDDVCTRLKPSKLHRGGVGVFAIRSIKKGCPIFGDDETEIIWIKQPSLTRLPKSIRKLYDDFAIIKYKGKLYGCPRSFNLLTLSWYLNSSTNPNVRIGKGYRFFALRNIRAGEELTVNYLTYSELPR